MRKTVGNHRIIYLDINAWGGKTIAEDKDYLSGVVDGALPPKELVTRGNKWLVNKTSLQVFDSLRKRAERTLKAKAVFLHGVWLVPDDAYDEVVTELNTLREEYAVEALSYVDSLHGAWDAWRESNGAWGALIVSELPDRDKLLASFDFKWGLLLEDETMSDGLYSDIEASAKKLIKNVWGKPVFSRASLVHIRTMREKLDSLASLDPRVPPVVMLIDETLAAIPVSGNLPIAPMLGLLSLLSDAEQLKDYGAKALTEAPMAMAA